MGFFNVVIFCLNLIILLFIADKLRKILALRQQFKQIQDNIALLVKENTRVVDVMLEDLENKISEAKETIGLLEQHEKRPGSEELLPHKETKEEQGGGDVPPKPQNAGSKIIYLRQQGLSVQEIAEQLSVPQGEISLKLNLFEKSIQK